METDRVLLSPAQRHTEGREKERLPGRHVVIVAWRDIASPQAGGSELLVDQLAAGLTARGDRVTLLCGGPSAAHSYEVVRSGHKSVCTWLTMQIIGLRDHSGARNGMPLQTSTTTSQSRRRRR